MAAPATILLVLLVGDVSVLAEEVKVAPWWLSAPTQPTIRLECPGWAGGIAVGSATYGGLIGEGTATGTTAPCPPAPPDNVLERLRGDCDGLQVCAITACLCHDGAATTCPCPDKSACFPPTSSCWTDPASGCQKGFEATYTCSGRWGVLFNIFFVTGLSVYLAGGVAWSAKVQGKAMGTAAAQACQLHPHSAQWSAIYALVVDGVTFSRRKAAERGWIEHAQRERPGPGRDHQGLDAGLLNPSSPLPAAPPQLEARKASGQDDSESDDGLVE